MTLDFGQKTAEQIKDALSDPTSQEFKQFISRCYSLSQNYQEATADICKEYIEAGADPTISDADGVFVPMLCFAQACAAVLLQLCVKQKARYTKQFYEVLDSEGRNALHICAASKPESAADPKAQEQRFASTIAVLCDDMGFSLIDKDIKGNTPIHHAILAKSQIAVEYCVNAFISRDTTRSPLQAYPLKNIESADDVTDSVIDHHQSFYPHSKNNDGNSLWMTAVKLGIVNPKIYEAIYLIDDIRYTCDNEQKDLFTYSKLEDTDISDAASLALRLFEVYTNRDRINAIIRTTNEKMDQNPFNFTYKNVYRIALDNDIHELQGGKNDIVKMVKHDLNPRVIEHTTPAGPKQKSRVFNYVFNVMTSQHIHPQEVPARMEIDVACKSIPNFEDVPVILIDYNILSELNDQTLSKEGDKDAMGRLKQNKYLQVSRYPSNNNPWQIISNNHTCNITWSKGEIDDSQALMTISMLEYELSIKKTERERLEANSISTEMIDKIIATQEEELEKATALMNERTIKYELLGFFVTINVSIQKML